MLKSITASRSSPLQERCSPQSSRRPDARENIARFDIDFDIEFEYHQYLIVKQNPPRPTPKSSQSPPSLQAGQICETWSIFNGCRLDTWCIAMCNQSELKIEYVVGHPNILQTFKYDSACTSARVHLLNMTHLPRGRFSNALSAISSLSVKALENIKLSSISVQSSKMMKPLKDKGSPRQTWSWLFLEQCSSPECFRLPPEQWSCSDENIVKTCWNHNFFTNN